MKKYAFMFCAVSLGGFLNYANANAVKVDMKHGLWENTFKLTGDAAKQMQMLQGDQVKQGMEAMKAQMESLPPEQRKMIEDMMQQQGIKVSDKEVSFGGQSMQLSAEGTRIKHCVTQQEIEKGEYADLAENCTSTIKQHTKTRITSSFVCAGEAPTSGVSEITFLSPSHYTGTTTLTTSVAGEPHTLNGTLVGKWLSSNCGEIKPK